MLFQESDESGSLLNNKELDLHNKVQDWIWRTVKYEGGNIHIVSELYGVMKTVGMHVVVIVQKQYCRQLKQEATWHGLHRSCRKGCRQRVFIRKRKRLQQEMNSADKAFVRDLAYGICAEKDD